MSTTPGSAHAARVQEARLGPEAASLLEGLREVPKRISSIYLYDERGSSLFEAICRLPEYYPTRTETLILRTHSADIAREIGDDALLIEPGSGSSEKTRIVLDALGDVAAYVPVDISREALFSSAARLAADYPRIPVMPVCADFSRPFRLPAPFRSHDRKVVLFPGSTIGNFEPEAACAFLRSMRTMAGPRGGLLIGVDLVKDPRLLERAYDDAAGVTAEFNLNVLAHLNDAFGADFDQGAFAHEAVWVAEAKRVEMRLVSRIPQTVRICGSRVHFERGERLVTEYCHKYTTDSFDRLAARAGWSRTALWTDEHGQFSVHFLEASPTAN